MTKKECWRLVTYDVWGNEEDGYEVNNKFSTSTVVSIRENATDDQVITALRRAGVIKGVRSKSIDLDGDDEVIAVTDARDGQPAFELVKETCRKKGK